MITITGRDITLDGSNAPSLYDMGYSLCQTPRFAGYTIHKYSVLHHLLGCWKYATRKEYGPKVALYALLHDAHESMTGDISQPWKTDDMRELQRQLDVRVYSSLNLRLPDGQTERLVKTIDNQMVYAEAKAVAPQVAAAILKPGDNYRDSIDPQDIVSDAAVLATVATLTGTRPDECGHFFESWVNAAIKKNEQESLAHEHS